MRWPWWLRWRRHPPPPPVHRNGGAAKIRAEEEAKLRKAVRDTPVVEHIKGRMAQIPPDQFVARVQAIFEERGHRA